jgi:hypothetical protein
VIVKLGLEPLSRSLDVSDPNLRSGAPQSVSVDVFTPRIAPRLSLDFPLHGAAKMTASARYDLVNRAPTFTLGIGFDNWAKSSGVGE